MAGVVIIVANVLGAGRLLRRVDALGQHLEELVGRQALVLLEFALFAGGSDVVGQAATWALGHAEGRQDGEEDGCELHVDGW